MDQWLQKHLLKCRTKNLRLTLARNAPKCSKGLQHHFSSKQNKKDLHAYGYEFILPKSKLKGLIQLRKEKNHVTEFPGHHSFREAESYFQKLACNTIYHTTVVDDRIFSIPEEASYYSIAFPLLFLFPSPTANPTHSHSHHYNSHQKRLRFIYACSLNDRRRITTMILIKN